MNVKWFALGGIFFIIAGTILWINGAEAETLDTNDPRVMAKVWGRAMPELLKIAEAKSLVPLINAEGTTLHFFDSNLPLQDSETMHERMLHIKEILEVEQLWRSGPLHFAFGKKDPNGKEAFAMIEEARFTF